MRVDDSCFSLLNEAIFGSLHVWMNIISTLSLCMQSSIINERSWSMMKTHPTIGFIGIGVMGQSMATNLRSEERRVGKGCRSRGATYQYKKKRGPPRTRR